MSLVCQQCKHGLQLDNSIVDLAPSAYDMINASLPRKLATTVPGDSFVLLQDSIVKNIPTAPPPASNASPVPRQQPAQPLQAPAPLSDHLRSTTRLFRLLSDRTDIDHPLCAECTHVLLSALDKALDEAKRERDGYLAFARDLRNAPSPPVSADVLAHRIAALNKEEAAAIDELRDAEREKARLDDELRELDERERALAEEEAHFWRETNTRALAAAAQEAELRSLRSQAAADAAVLDMLERSNVYNDAFCIGGEGVFGTINGLRLGRAGGVSVEWTEINAAWGHTLLLLHTIARKIDYTFDMYTLHPLGSTSRIERHGGASALPGTSSDRTVLELYYSDDFALVRLFHNLRFDSAMVAFLECLRQVMEFAQRADSSVEFPHPIVRDKIGDASIKLQFNQEETWTRALRHVLLALKILLKWATSG